MPGKTKIVFAGRVYDEKALISLVDTSLEFCLIRSLVINFFFREKFVTYDSLWNSSTIKIFFS